MHTEEAPAAEGAAADPERAPREPGTWLGAVYEALCLGQPGHWRTGDELARCAASPEYACTLGDVACCLSSASMTLKVHSSSLRARSLDARQLWHVWT